MFEFRYPALVKSISQQLLNEGTDRLAAEFQPEELWLFGSHAWGEPDEGSDLDLLVVVRESAERPVRRAQRTPVSARLGHRQRRCGENAS